MQKKHFYEIDESTIAKTYLLGNSRVYIIAPPPMSKEEIDKRWKNVCEIVSKILREPD